MLLVVGLNLAVDRILRLPKLRVGEVQRTQKVITQPGGKGSNVARVFRQLGGDVALLGCVGRKNREAVVAPLEALGIRVEAIPAYESESRNCTIILEDSRHPTVINEESREVEFSALSTLSSRFDQLLALADFVLLTGSLPRGVPEDFYASVVRQASRRGVQTLIDATGDVLRLGLEANPTLVKVNVSEIGTVVESASADVPVLFRSIRQQQARLPSRTIVTLGEQGAVLVDKDREAWYVRPPRISHSNPIGSGDSFAAGLVKSLLDGQPPAEALRFASAVAASDAATPEPGFIVPSEIPELLANTKVSRLQNSEA